MGVDRQICLFSSAVLGQKKKNPKVISPQMRYTSGCLLTVAPTTALWFPLLTLLWSLEKFGKVKQREEKFREVK